MAYSLTCPVCNTKYNKDRKFCGECGCNLSEVDAITVSVNPKKKDEIMSSLKSSVQKIGEKTQQGLSDASNVIADKAFNVTQRANSARVQERVSEAMGNLVNLMINVSKDVSQSIPSDMVNAIDLEAEVNFVAFTIGVTIDLAEINQVKSTTESLDPNIET
jgi:hypothetical protein